jgi:hypothetical protein
MESITDALSIIKILRVLIPGLGRFAAKRMSTPSQPFTTLLVKDSFGSTAEILELLGSVSFTPASRPIRRLK